MSSSQSSKLRNAVILIVLSTASYACTLLLSKETLSCNTDSDCAKFNAVCDLNAHECREGTPVDSGTDQDAAIQDGGGDVDAPYDGSDPCGNPNKPLVELKGDITTNLTLTCESDYLIVGRVAIVPPYSATVAAGTTIYGDPRIDPTTNSLGTLIVPPGSRLVAIGQPESPVVFTSAKKKDPVKYATDGGLESGDWGGIFLLGEAPVNTPTQTATKPGLVPWGQYGGNKPNNDSGHLEYVRIEYAGAKLPDGSDGTALELAGVGDQTIIDHVQVRFSLNDCVEVLGGTVNMKHFLCQYPSDDGIAWENGWTGKVQFLVVQGRPGIDDGSNGLQGRSGAPPAVPISEPILYNATFCGQNLVPGTNQQYGVRLESYSHMHLFNALVLGWEAAIDFRGTTVPTDVSSNGIEFKNSIAYGNITTNVAFDETQTTGGTANVNFDDDNAFNEAVWWRSAANANSESNPSITKCFDPKSPVFSTSSPLGAVATVPGEPNAAQPPNDGFFDPTAKYIGAFKDQSDLWATGKWVVWSDK